MKIYKAPDFTPFNTIQKGRFIFLAGSIEMGSAENWQEKVESLLNEVGFNVLNPRRDDWDSSWEQTIENEEFERQVRWELAGLEKADAVLVHIEPETKSPITLMELGLLSQLKPDKTFISCPKGFWRRGNIEVLCDRYKIALFDNIERTIGALIWSLNK